MTDFTRDDLLDILETSLKAQLRAVRSLRSGPPPPSPPEPVERRSNISIAEYLLKEAGHPLPSPRSSNWPTPASTVP